jgi:hypothetical protein
MRCWSESFDLSSIPDNVLASEWARRRGAKRRTFGAGTGRPKTIRTCLWCQAKLSAMEMRRHICPAK